MEFILPVVWFIGLFWSISKLNFFKSGPFSSQSLQLAFGVRVAMGFLLFLIYSLYYPVRQDADTFKYFDDSQYMYEAFWTNPLDYFKMLFGVDCHSEHFNSHYFNNMSNWVRSYDNGLFNDNRLVIRVNAFLRLFSFGNYHVHSIILSYLAFMGSFALAKVFFEVSKSKSLSYIAVFLVPSVVFWSSGILKEAILLSAMGFFVYHFYQLFGVNRRYRNYVMVFLMSCILIVMKLYVFTALIPAIFIWFTVKKWNRSWWVYFGMYVSFLGLATVIGEFNPRLDFINLIVDKQKQFINLSNFYVLTIKEITNEKNKEELKLFGIEKLNIKRSEIPAVTHVDYSARIQTVTQKNNKPYYDLISKFKEITGCPVIVNTSFNVRGEPIVNTPTDAFNCFMGTELDYLVIGNCILEKTKQDPNLKKDYTKEFELD